MSPADLEACQFRMRSSHVPLKHAAEDYARDCLAPGRPIASAAHALTRQIYRDFDYVPGSTTNRTSITEVLESRRGVCQDFAHLMIGCLRSSRSRRPLRERLHPYGAAPASRTRWSAAMPPTPGYRSTARRTAGSISIRPTTAWSARIT